MRAAIAVGMISLYAAMPVFAQDDGFVSPLPEAGRPAVAAPAAPSTNGARKRAQRAAAPVSPCEDMTKDWVDLRPVADFPALEGRVLIDLLQAALPICEAAQRDQPGNKRVTFVFARTLAIHGQNTRAAQLYRQLASARYVPAMTQLARAYYTGAGVPRDVVEACTRYVEAAKAGDAWAFNPAADCAILYSPVADQRRACQYFRKAQASDTAQTTTLTEADYCP